MWEQTGLGCGPGCARALHGAAGQYSTIMFAARAVEIIEQHDAGLGLFLYLAFQAVHSPSQVPAAYADKYARTIADKRRRNFAGMLACADEGIANTTAALERRGLAGRTVTVLIADNGGASDQGPCAEPPCCPAAMSYCRTIASSNFPWRGGKHTMWEGGVRTVAIVHAPWLIQNGTYAELFHVSDWLPTIVSLVAAVNGTAAAAAWRDAALRRPKGLELDGVDQWPALGRGTPPSGPPRQEVLIQWDPRQAAYGGKLGDAPHSAIRVGKYKLMLGPPGCPDSRLPPFRAALRPGSGPSAACQSRMDAWCDDRGNCPGPSPPANFTRWHAHCGASASAPFVARRERAWRCVPAADTGHPECHCSRDAELRRVWCACDPAGCSGPPPPPPPLQPACKRLPETSVLLFDVELDPYEVKNVAPANPAVVERLRRRILAHAAEFPPIDYPDSDVAADPTRHNGTWTPWRRDEL